MPVETESPPFPSVLVDALTPVSIFLIACRADGPKTRELELRSTCVEPGEEIREVAGDGFTENVDSLEVKLHIQPKIYLIPGEEWLVVGLLVRIEPNEGSSVLDFKKLLSINSLFRFCQGDPERQDTPMSLDGDCMNPQIGMRPGDIYERAAHRALGRYEIFPSLNKAVTLSLASFDRTMDDRELYLFGTVAHADEVVAHTWASDAVMRQAYDRWRPLGTRFFVHSYSMVCACSSREIAQEMHSRFCGPYTIMGVRQAMYRAGLMQFQSRLHNHIPNIPSLRNVHEGWVDFRRRFGVRWNSEGTQRIAIERLWRSTSGLDEQSDEIDRVVAQTVDFFEAEATDRLNQIIILFQSIFVAFAGAGITASVIPTPQLGIIVSVLVVAAVWIGLFVESALISLLIVKLLNRRRK